MLLFLDTETTGFRSDDKVLQIAHMRLNEPCQSSIINAGKASDPGAEKIHGVTLDMMKGKPTFNEYSEAVNLIALTSENIVVAHNAQFDMRMLRQEGLFVEKYICTLKVAQNVNHGAPNNKLQTLRDHFNIEIEATAHDAEGDVLVLAEVFKNLYELVKDKFLLTDEADVLQKMIDLTHCARILSVMPFGKHKGKTFEVIKSEDPGYIQWMLGSMKEKKNTKGDLYITLQKYAK